MVAGSRSSVTSSRVPSTSRRSLRVDSQAQASSSESRSASTVAAITPAASSRRSRRSSPMKRRYSVSISSSSEAGGNSRRNDGSSGVSFSSSCNCDGNVRSRSRSSLSSRSLKLPSRLRSTLRRTSEVLLHRRPQAVLMEPEHVELGALPGTRRHHRPALVVDVEHELGRLLLAVAEQLLEHERDVGHQVDGVVPDDHEPGAVREDDIVDAGLVELDGSGRRCHARDSPRSPAATVTWNHVVATHTAEAPAMWMPTSTAGTPVKYCTYPTTACATSTARRTSTRRRSTGEAPDRTSPATVYSTSPRNRATAMPWRRATSPTSKANRRAVSSPPWGPEPVTTVPSRTTSAAAATSTRAMRTRPGSAVLVGSFRAIARKLPTRTAASS